MSPAVFIRYAGLAIALASALLLARPGHASIHYLMKDDRICDRTEELCLRGTLTYNDLNKVLFFRGRLQKGTAPGLVTLRLRGTTPAGQYAVVEFRFEVRGQYSEIVEQRFASEYPYQTEWEISVLLFEPRPKD